MKKCFSREKRVIRWCYKYFLEMRIPDKEHLHDFEKQFGKREYYDGKSIPDKSKSTQSYEEIDDAAFPEKISKDEIKFIVYNNNTFTRVTVNHEGFRMNNIPMDPDFIFEIITWCKKLLGNNSVKCEALIQYEKKIEKNINSTIEMYKWKHVLVKVDFPTIAFTDDEKNLIEISWNDNYQAYTLAKNSGSPLISTNGRFSSRLLRNHLFIDSCFSNLRMLKILNDLDEKMTKLFLEYDGKFQWYLSEFSNERISITSDRDITIFKDGRIVTNGDLLHNNLQGFSERQKELIEWCRNALK